MLRLHVLLLAASHRSTLMTPCNLNMPQPRALALLKLATHSVFMSSLSSPFFAPLLILLITRGGSLQGPLTCSLSNLLYRGGWTSSPIHGHEPPSSKIDLSHQERFNIRQPSCETLQTTNWSTSQSYAANMATMFSSHVYHLHVYIQVRSWMDLNFLWQWPFLPIQSALDAVGTLQMLNSPIGFS